MRIGSARALSINSLKAFFASRADVVSMAEFLTKHASTRAE
jgi:hypothetical protein